MIIHDREGTPISTANPLPIQAHRNAGSFDAFAYSENAFSQALQVRAATSGKKIHITDVVISSSIAMRVILKDSDGTEKLRVYLAANAPFQKTFNTPMQLTASKALVASSSKQGPLAIQVAGYEI